MLFPRLLCAQSLSRAGLFVTPWTIACQAPLSTEFSRQKYWSGLPFPPPGDLPDPGIEPRSLASPALAGGSLPLCPNIHLLFIAALFAIAKAWRLAIAKTWRLAIAKTWRLPCLSYCRHGCNEHRGACTVLPRYMPKNWIAGSYGNSFFFFLSDIGNHWKLLSRVMMKSDVCFKRTSLNPPTLLVGMYQ